MITTPKRQGKNQPRDGNSARRKLEWETIVWQVKHNKERLIKRFSSRLEQQGECLLYRGTRDRTGGYPKISFRTRSGEHIMIAACRVFLILKTKKPIPLGYEAGHEGSCVDKACIRHIKLQHWSSNATGAPF